MFLSEVGGVTDAVTADTLVAGLLEISTNVLDFILANPLMTIMFASSLVGVACYVLRKVKKTAKS